MLHFGASVRLIAQCFAIIAIAPATTTTLIDESSYTADKPLFDEVTADTVVKALGRFFTDAMTFDLRHDEIQKILEDSSPSRGSGSTSSAGHGSLRNESNSSSAVRQSLLGKHHLEKPSLHDYSDTFDSWLLGIVDDYKSELEGVLGKILLKCLKDSTYKCDAAEFSPGGEEEDGAIAGPEIKIKMEPVKCYSDPVRRFVCFPAKLTITQTQGAVTLPHLSAAEFTDRECYIEMKFTHFGKNGEHKLVEHMKKNTKNDDKGLWPEHKDTGEEDISKISHEIQQFYKELLS